MNMNFFVQQLVEYFAESGKSISSGVLSVLAKPLGSLNQEEADIYNRLVGPAQRNIIAALQARFQQLGSPKKEWSQQINPYYRPIVEEIAAQILGIEKSVPLPDTVVARVTYRYAETKKEGFIKRLSVPRISYKWVIAIVVIIALIAMGGWFYYSSTAPSRMLDQVITELESGEYQAALRHIEEMREKYPDKGETRKAEKLEPWAARGYADELYASARYEEAAYYFELASTVDELENDALIGCAGAYLGAASVHSGNQEYKDGYECCESALECAPEGYDINAIMALRADILYNWGMQLKNQNMYAMSAIRFEKCFTEWPAGPLAQDAMVNYVDMTAAGYTNQMPNKTPISNGRVEVRITNPTSLNVRFFFSGPVSTYFDLGPNGSTTTFLPPGIYSEGFRTPKGEYFKAGITYEVVRGYWTITIPTPELASNQGVAYDDVISRVDALETTLPQELLDCVDDLEYFQITDLSQIQDMSAGYDPETNSIGFTLNIPPEELDRVIFHEWGHAYDDEYLDKEEKEQYMELRGILSDTLWGNPNDYKGSVEEDFAEVFAVIFANAPWTSHTPYGPVVNGEELKAFILAAAD